MREVFDEAFSQTSYITLAEVREPAQAGRYRGVVVGAAPSRFSVAIGEREEFFTPTERSGERPSSFPEMAAPLQAWYSTPPGAEAPVDGSEGDAEIQMEMIEDAIESGESTAAEGPSAEQALGEAEPEEGGSLGWVAPAVAVIAAGLGAALVSDPPARRRTGMTRLPGRRWIGPVAIFIIALPLFGLASGSGAHSTDQPYLYVFVTESGVDGRAELAIGDVETVLGLDLSGDDATIEAVLRDNAGTLYRYLADHLAISTADQDRLIEFGAVDVYREGSTELAFAVIQYTAGDHTTIPQTLDIRFDPFFDEIEGKDALLLISGGFELGEFTTAKETLVNVNADERQPLVDLGADGRWGNFRSSILLGVNHIETGPDHILFVLALLIPSVLVFTDRWEPVAGFGSGLWRVLKIATFFTLAHSITFTLAGMGWLPTPPAKVVEAVIAISIAAAALHTLRPLMPNREWILSFVFGLFHGMGFASLVSDLNVSRSSQLISLLGRNVGIEIGQVVVILLLFPGLFLLRRTPFYQPFVIVASLSLAAVASLWTVERLAEVDLGTDGLVEAFASVPRGYWLSMTFAGLGAMAFVWSHRTDRLNDPVS